MLFLGKNDKIAVISNDFTDFNADVAIYKPNDYKAGLPCSFTQGNFEKFVYYPAFCMEEDEKAIRVLIESANNVGIYAENYAGIAFANKLGVPVFAGTGLNLSNSTSIQAFMSIPNAAYYAISKELNDTEGQALVGEKAFVLSSGNIKLMDICYCPFGKTCNQCDKKDVYTLTDEDGREFPVRRYVSANGQCRFEVYNCADLIGIGLQGGGKLLDLSVEKNKLLAIQAVHEENKQKSVYKKYTSGHAKRGVL